MRCSQRSPPVAADLCPAARLHMLQYSIVPPPGQGDRRWLASALCPPSLPRPRRNNRPASYQPGSQQPQGRANSVRNNWLTRTITSCQAKQRQDTVVYHHESKVSLSRVQGVAHFYLLLSASEEKSACSLMFTRQSWCRVEMGATWGVRGQKHKRNPPFPSLALSRVKK